MSGAYDDYSLQMCDDAIEAFKHEYLEITKHLMEVDNERGQIVTKLRNLNARRNQLLGNNDALVGNDGEQRVPVLLVE